MGLFVDVNANLGESEAFGFGSDPLSGKEIISPAQSNSRCAGHTKAFFSSANLASMVSIADRDSLTCCVCGSTGVGEGVVDKGVGDLVCHDGGLGWEEGDGDGDEDFRR